MLVHFYRFVDKIKGSPGRKNRTLIICTIIGMILNLFIWSLIFFRLRPIVKLLPADQAFIPLHYNTYLGVDNFGPWYNIFILPALGLLIFIVNSLLAATIYNRKDILSYFLVITNMATQFVLLVSTIFIILINI